MRLLLAPTRRRLRMRRGDAEGKARWPGLRQVVLDRLNRPKAHPHMLRHSFASRLRENGADLQDIQEALGHAAITTTTMYAHLTTRRQPEKLAEYLK
jgi:site-specific recombinase XerD